MRIMVGERAPDFTATAVDGSSISLSALKGQRVWLAFYRFAACPFCNLRIHEVAQRTAGFMAQGVRVLAVFQSSREKVQEVQDRHKVPFPVLCDPHGDLYKLYRLEESVLAAMSPANLPRLLEAHREGMPITTRPDGPVTRVPADFLIDAAGVVRVAFYGKAISEHIPFVDVERWASSPRAGNASMSETRAAPT